MRLSPADREVIARFRESFETALRGDPRFLDIARSDREDESSLSSRFKVGDKLWLDLTIRPFLPQIRTGIFTDDRWFNDDLEQVVEDSGDTMSEFVELGFEEAGLTWENPTVEHYRDQGKYFFFATALDLPRLTELADAAVGDKVRRMFLGYYEAFRPAIRRAAGASA